MINPKLIQLSPNVQAALDNKQPVVALESTVIAHGLPSPQNLTTGRRLEEIVSAVGAMPATVAILRGVFHVGLDKTQLKRIANEDNVKKVSTRDLPMALAEGWDGATTVATTAWIAHRAGVKVFATGGIGGVHRGPLPDVSADLPELARTPIVVVCSGAKIVLDLPATREWLETHGITVVGYGCNEMPAFYSRTSGLPVDVKATNPRHVATLFRAQRALGLSNALLVTVPVPRDYEIPSKELNRVLTEALEQADKMRIAGRELTPFLLSRMAEKSKRATLRANIALLENNARVAAEIAKSIAELKI